MPVDAEVLGRGEMGSSIKGDVRVSTHTAERFVVTPYLVLDFVDDMVLDIDAVSVLDFVDDMVLVIDNDPVPVLDPETD